MNKVQQAATQKEHNQPIRDGRSPRPPSKLQADPTALLPQLRQREGGDAGTDGHQDDAVAGDLGLGHRGGVALIQILTKAPGAGREEAIEGVSPITC